MARVFNSPMASYRVGKLLHAYRQATDVIARLHRFFAVANADRCHHTDRLQAFPTIPFAQRVGYRHLNVTASLLPAMTRFLGDVPTRLRLGKIVVALFLDVRDDRIVQRSLVSFQRQNIVRSARHDLLRNRLLRAHRVDRDDRALDVYQPQKLGNGCDFVRLLLTRDLSERQPEFAGPHRDAVQSPQRLAAIMTAPQRLAIHSQNRLLNAGGLGRLATQEFQPLHEARLKGPGLERHQYASKNVFARNPVWQLQPIQQELRLHGGPLGDGRRSTGARQDRQHGDDHHADQRMLAVDLRTGILQLVKILDNFVQIDMTALDHRLSSVNSKCFPRRTVYGLSNRAPVYPDCPKFALALPEPASVLLIGLGLLGSPLLLAGRRRAPADGV